VAKIGIKVDDAKASDKLAILEAAAANPQPLYATIGTALVNRIRLCFKMGVDPWGSPWQKIKFRAPAIQRVMGKDGNYKAKRDAAGNLVHTKKGVAQLAANAAGNAGQPLRDTGALQRSISSSATADHVAVGTNLKYARIHQFGGVIRPKNKKMLAFPGPTGAIVFAKKVTIPARPYMPLRRASTEVALPPAWSLLITNAIKAHLNKAVAAAEV